MQNLRTLVSRFTAKQHTQSDLNTNRKRNRKLPKTVRRKMLVENLEMRSLFATFAVLNTDDSGPGSLRQAILDSNNNPGSDLITFNIPGSGPHTIAPLTTLPDISDTIIDGSTQPGFEQDGLHPVELSGENLPWAGTGDNQVGGLNLFGDATIRGLTVNRFYYGIVPRGSGNHIEGNYVGTDPEGLTVPAAGISTLYSLQQAVSMRYGIAFQYASQSTVGGPSMSQRNLISGCEVGVELYPYISGPDDHNLVQGNFIGTNRSGNAALGNVIGVSGGSASSVIGGFAASERNVISGNHVGAMPRDSRLVGNYIGTDVSGMQGVANVWGVMGGNIIGGTEIGAGNLISGNKDYGIQGGQVIQGNLIGTDRTGNAVIPNQTQTGVYVFQNDAIVGGVTPNARNIICGNNVGVFSIGFGTNLTVQGNYIGRSLSGADLGNSIGVYSMYHSDSKFGGHGPGEGNFVQANNVGFWLQKFTGSDIIEGNQIIHNELGIAILAGNTAITIGGRSPGAGNTISSNGRGIELTTYPGVPGPAKSITIAGNSIFANRGLGIDLNGDGVTLNDPLDADTGSNDLQNFPVLASASSASTTRVQGSLHSTPNSTFTVDFYASSSLDSSGYGEGERYLGFTTVTTDASGNGTFDASLAATTTVGEYITSTATDAQGSTSEFSQGVQTVQGIQTVSVDIQPTAINLDSKGALTVTVFASPDFNASRIDVNTVRFAGASVWQRTLVDINGDGRLDMQFKFRREDTNLYNTYIQLLLVDYNSDGKLDTSVQHASLSITGKTLDGTSFSGADYVDLFMAGKRLKDLLTGLFGT